MSCERLLRQLAYHPAFLGVDVRRDDAVSEPRNAIELSWEDLAPVGGRDQHGRSGGIPRQRPDGVVDEVHAITLVRDWLSSPQHTPDLHVLLETPDATLVVRSARRPLTL